MLVPLVESADPSLDYYNDYSQARAEFERAFEELGIQWRWEPVTTRSFRSTIDRIVGESAAGGRLPVLFNLCDGDETNGAPGVSVIQYLDELGLRYTGADESFYQNTTSKIGMKQAFDRHAVPTAPWEIVASTAKSIRGVFERCGSPLIVKPAVSAGSMGITVKSVVTTEAALVKQAKALRKGYHGWDLASGGIFVERYIAGPEFTALIVGRADAPEQSVVYPSVERVFHGALPATEQFLSYDRLWEIYEREAPIGDGEYLWEYRAAPAELDERIRDVSWAAYKAVGGSGYGRVDLRMCAESGELHVLEVNAQCGLSEDENYTSIGAILRFAGRSFAGLVAEILEAAGG